MVIIVSVTTQPAPAPAKMTLSSSMAKVRIYADVVKTNVNNQAKAKTRKHVNAARELENFDPWS